MIMNLILNLSVRIYLCRVLIFNSVEIKQSHFNWVHTQCQSHKSQVICLQKCCHFCLRLHYQICKKHRLTIK